MSPRSGGAGKEQRRSGWPRWPSSRLTLQSPDSPVRAAEEQRGGYSLQCCWIPVLRPVGPALPTSCRAGGRAEPGQVGSAGGCAAGGRDAPWAPAAPRLPHLAAPAASPHYLGPACVHVTSLGVRAGVRPWVLSTLPPAPTPASFLRLSLGSSASSRKPSERARACGNLFAEGRPHPLHSLQQATSGQP